MTAPENTSKRDPLLHLLGAMESPSSYITDMESAGQRQLVNSDVLPKEGPWDELDALGFTRLDDVDDLFVRATLPAGWKREGSDHAMWSYLLDGRGIRRVGVFYKAAFYDRKADMNMVNAGCDAATKVLYGDEPVALPDKWALFTEGERASFVASLDGMDAQITEHPGIYGKYADRLAAVRVLVTAVSA